MKPEKSDMAIGIMNDEVTKMTKTVDAEMLSKVKELMLKRADENVKKNNYWLGVIQSFDEYGVDTNTDYKKIVSEMTPEKMAKFMKNVIIGGGNSIKVIMLPDTMKK